MHLHGIAVAQAERAGDLDEEQAALRLPLQRVGQLLQHERARGQAGVAVDRGARGLQRLGALARALDAVGDRRDQVAWPDRLVEEVVGTAFEHLELALRIRIAGQEHDRQVQVFRLLPQQHGQRHAVLAGHVQVHQHQVGAEAAHRVEQPVGLHLHLGLHAGPVQHALREQRLAAVVFDDKNGGRAGGHRKALEKR